jgi:hypothetical protein
MGRASDDAGRVRLSDDLEVLADRAVQRGAVNRASDLRAVAEHLRGKEARTLTVPVRATARPVGRVRRWRRRLLGRTG